MSKRPKIVVIGGGIGGLTAAVAMSQRDLEVAVYERASEIGEIGAGVTLAPNALKAYGALGLTESMERIGYESDFQVVRKWDTGEEVSRVNRKGYKDLYGAPYLSMHRADLVEAIAAAVPSGALTLSAQCVSVENADGYAVATFADGSQVEADLIVGADGIHSAVRRSVFGAEDPRFTGTVCWRGLVPYDELPKEFSKDWHMYIGPGKHLIYYMVRQGDLVNFVAHIEADSWTGESWTQGADRSEVLEAFEGWHEPLQHLIRAADQYYKWALFDRDPLASWSRGNVTLLGDSVHAMPPFIGQGAGMSIEDGYALAASLDYSPQDIPSALALYESLRVERASGAVDQARAARDDLHMKTTWNSQNSAPAKDKTGINQQAIYDYDITEVADFSGLTPAVS